MGLGAVICIAKNLHLCGDCHNAIKFIFVEMQIASVFFRMTSVVVVVSCKKLLINLYLAFLVVRKNKNRIDFFFIDNKVLKFCMFLNFK